MKGFVVLPRVSPAASSQRRHEAANSVLASSKVRGKALEVAHAYPSYISAIYPPVDNLWIRFPAKIKTRTMPTFQSSIRGRGSPLIVGALPCSKTLFEAERDQDADCTRIDAAVRLAEQDIAALASRRLDPDQTHRKWSEIRDRTILAVRDVRRNIVKRANEAKKIKKEMIETFFRERAAYPSNDNAPPLA